MFFFQFNCICCVWMNLATRKWSFLHMSKLRADEGWSLYTEDLLPPHFLKCFFFSVFTKLYCPSQGTVNGGALSKWPRCWRDVKHKQTNKLNVFFFFRNKIIMCCRSPSVHPSGRPTIRQQYASTPDLTLVLLMLESPNLFAWYPMHRDVGNIFEIFLRLSVLK